MRKKKSLFGAILCICTLFAVLVGCPTESGSDTVPSPSTGYSLALSQDEVSLHVFLGGFFEAPEPVGITVTNTGTEPTGDLFLTIKNDPYEIFSLVADEIPSIPVGSSGSFQVLIPQTNPGHDTGYAIEVEIGNGHVIKTFKLNYKTASVEIAEIDGIPDFIRVGQSITPIIAGKDPSAAWFTSNDSIAVPNGNSFDLIGEGTATIGYAASADPYVIKGMAINVYEQETPYIVAAQIEDSSPDQVKVTFSKPVVNLIKEKFQVLVTVMPKGSAFPYENGTVAETREITAVNGADAIWTLTMAKPAAYGEILRLKTTEAGAALDTQEKPAALKAVNQFIVRSLVKRTRAAFETAAGAAGFYIDGEKQDTPANGPGLLKAAITTINSKSAADKRGKTWTVVLDQAQTNFNPGGTFGTDASVGTFTGSTLIVTANGTTDINVHWANNGGVFTARSGMTIIVDEHIVFTGKDIEGNQLNNNHHFMMAMDQGRVILDGCEFRNIQSTIGNDAAGALRIGGGANGAILLINNAKIINNSITSSGTNMAYAGAIVASDRAMLVIHDGEISGNVAKGSAACARAGAISSRMGTAVQNPAIYITGGVIKNNRAEGSGNKAAAGGLLIGATFQKTRGAIIKDNVAEDTLTGDIVSQNIAFITQRWTNTNPDPAYAILYNGPAEATDDVLSNTVLSTDPTGNNTYKISDWIPIKEDPAYPWDK